MRQGLSQKDDGGLGGRAGGELHMHTKIYHINETEPESELLAAAAEVIRRGGLVAFPTETVYGLGASALDAAAAKKIYAAKGRPSDNPLIVHIAELSEAERCFEVTELFYVLAQTFWPGPLTMILPKKECIPVSVTGGLDTVAVRMPAHPAARGLIRQAGVPIAAPSANLSGHPSPTEAAHVIRDLDGRIDMILAAGSCSIGVESTVVRLEGENLRLLRPGGVTLEELSGCIGASRVILDQAVTEKLKEGTRPASPGMKYRHYAPRARVILLRGEDAEVRMQMRERLEADCRSGALCFDEDLPLLSGERTLSMGGVHDSKMQAHRLFSCLRAFDDMEVETVYARLPEKSGMGLALYNRLTRAAGFVIEDVPAYRCKEGAKISENAGETKNIPEDAEG